MDILDRRVLKDRAAERLQQQDYSPRRLALIHAGLIFAALMAVTGINYYVNHMMNGAVGLSGMGMLSVLETVQVVLGYAINILLPFWQMGFLFAALQMARGTQTRPGSLTEGFRRFGPILRLMLLRGLIYGGLFTVCVYVGTMIYAVTPLARPLMELMLPVMDARHSFEEMQQAVLQLPQEQVMAAIMPAFIIVIPVCLLVMVPLFYRFRLADLVIMDKPKTGALAALMLSGALTRKRKLALFKLDLSFWWYFALQLVGIILSDLNLLSVDLGVPMLVPYIAGCAVQMVAFWLFGSRFHTTWAVAYDQLRQLTQIPQPRPATQNLPWEEYSK